MLALPMSWPELGVALPLGALLAAGPSGLDGSIRLWSVGPTGVAEVDRIVLRSVGDAATSVAFAPSGRSLFVGTLEGNVLRFELRE